MKREMCFWLLLFVAICVVVTLLGCCPKCPAAEIGGVLTNERVVNLPQDQTKWYISIVGTKDAEHYERLIGWFNTNENLAKLKSQVHFKPVNVDTVIFNERYKSNIKGLPTVRVQEADGTVVYEAAGKYLPLTSNGLYGAIADATSVAQNIRPILPWRRQMESRPCPGPCPTPPAPEPTPEPDDGGPPEVDDSGFSIVLVVLLCLLSGVVGAAIGVIVEWKRENSLQ